MKLQSKPGGLMSVKTKLLKGLQSVRGVDDPAHTQQNGMEGDLRPLKDGDRGRGAAGFELILGLRVFTVFDLHKMDAPLSWSEMICAAYVHGGKACSKRAFADTFEKDFIGTTVASWQDC
eukprot:1158567-Pelagomonas_calceolata.AAC.2